MYKPKIISIWEQSLKIIKTVNAPFRIDCEVDNVTVFANLSVEVTKKFWFWFPVLEIFHRVSAHGRVDLVVRIMWLASLKKIGKKLLFGFDCLKCLIFFIKKIWTSKTKSIFLKKWAIPGLFFVYLRLFKQTLQFLQQISMKNVHPVYSARIRTHDLQTRALAQSVANLTITLRAQDSCSLWEDLSDSHLKMTEMGVPG